MKIITVATHSESYFPIFEESCKKNNLELIVLGFGQKWQGFSWRFKLISDYIENLPLNEVIIISDAYDVIVLQNNNNCILSQILRLRQVVNHPDIAIPNNIYNNIIDNKPYNKINTIINNIYKKYNIFFYR